MLPYGTNQYQCFKLDEYFCQLYFAQFDLFLKNLSYHYLITYMCIIQELKKVIFRKLLQI